MSQILTSENLKIFYWILMSIIVLLLDYVTGPLIQFPILYLFPIVYATWANGRLYEFILAVLLPALRIFFIIICTVPWTIFETIINASIRIAVFSAFVYLVDQFIAQSRELKKEIKLLKGFLKICCVCKNIMNENEEWVMLENYVRENSEVNFSHSYCPDCEKIAFNEIRKKKSDMNI